MCLLAYNQPPKIATDDIPIFKYLIKMFNRWYTPYRYSIVPIDNTLIGKFTNNYLHIAYNQHIAVSDIHYIPIGSGFIHAYITKYKHFDTGTLIRGYIPKGTKYHISTDGYCICAKKIILTFD